MVKLNYKNISEIEIGIYEDGPIGVGVSCGADSGLLLYVLMSTVKEHIHIYNMMGKKRRHALESHFHDVVEKCSQLTGNTNYTIHKNIVEDTSVEYIMKMITKALDSREIDLAYLGVTKFPPKTVYKSWDEQQPVWHNELRSDEIIHPVFGLTIPNVLTDLSPLTIDRQPTDSLVLDKRTYIPWINHNKKDIALMYESLQLLDTLFPVTRSCENDNHPGSHCGSCWWCNERLWAFNKLV